MVINLRPYGNDKSSPYKSFDRLSRLTIVCYYSIFIQFSCNQLSNLVDQFVLPSRKNCRAVVSHRHLPLRCSYKQYVMWGNLPQALVELSQYVSIYEYQNTNSECHAVYDKRYKCVGTQKGNHKVYRAEPYDKCCCSANK